MACRPTVEPLPFPPIPTRLWNDAMEGFTRTIYDNGYKYTMVYPPGWTQGDPRQPQVSEEPSTPGPSNPRIAQSRSLFRQHAHLGRISDPDPYTHGTTEATESVMQDVRKTVWSHSLKKYLQRMWLPKYVLSAQVDPSVRYEWPFLPALVRFFRSRKLYLVERISESDLYDTIDALKEVLDDVRLTVALLEQGKLSDLTLPDAVCCDLDMNDGQFLDNFHLSSPSDVSTLLHAYPLRTVLKIMKLFLFSLDDQEMHPHLRFDNVNHLCPVRYAGLFDLIAMPGDQADEFSLLVVVVPPWDVSSADFEEFARVGVPEGDLNLVHSASIPAPPSDVLWAIIWDMCLKHRCRFFVLTSYDDWVFGTLSEDMHRATVTSRLCAPVFPREMAVSTKDVTQPCFPNPNVLETLLIWMFAAGDGGRTLWSLPPDLADPVQPDELSMSDAAGSFGSETEL